MKLTSHRFTGLMTLIFIVSLSLHAQVGINTTSPLAMLHIDEPSTTTGPLFSEITATTSNWSGVEGYNPNTSGGAGMIATGNIGLLGQGATGLYGYGFAGVYGEPVDIALDWAGYFAGDINSDQDIYYAGALIDLSDERVKTNIRSLDGAISTVAQLRPVVYDKIIDKKDITLDISSLTDIKAKGKRAPFINQNEYGLIAQEVEEVLPGLVKEKRVKLENSDITSLKGVDYVGIVPLLIKAIQEQQQMINDQQSRIKLLERKLGLSENDD